MSTLILFFPITLIIGILTTREDFLNRKIKNKYVLAGILYAFTIYFFALLIYLLYKHWNITIFLTEYALFLTSSLNKWGINLILSTIIAYFIWKLKIWGAGDAKLFICYAALVPISQYPYKYFEAYFQSFFLLLIIFFPAAAFVLIQAIIFFIKTYLDLNIIKIKFSSLRSICCSRQKIIEYLKIFGGFFIIFLMGNILILQFNHIFSWLKSSSLLFVVILLFRFLLNIFKKRFFWFLIFFTIILVIYGIFTNFAYYNLFWEIIISLKLSLIMFIALPLLNGLIDFYSRKIGDITIGFAFWMFFGVILTWGIRLIKH